MSTVLLVIVGLAVVGIAIALVALARQIGVIHERINPAAALKSIRPPQAGEPAPPLQLTTLAGDGVSWPPHGSAALLFVGVDCPICKSLFPVLSPLKATCDVWVIGHGGSESEHRTLAAAHRLDTQWYVANSHVAQIFGVKAVPFAVFVSDRKIQAVGLIHSQEELLAMAQRASQAAEVVQAYEPAP